MIEPYDYKRIKRGDRIVIGILLTFLIILILFLNSENTRAEKSEDVVLWLARSCIGEAMWDGHKTGECAAIWHIYKKRMKPSGLSLYEVTRKYSAATKWQKGKHNPWLLHLYRDCDEPEKWPDALKWERYKDDCRGTMALAVVFLQGKIDDPTPKAMHYGSIKDRHRAIKAGWKFIRTGFRNQFWRVPGAN